MYISTEPVYVKYFVIFSSLKSILEKLKLNSVKLFIHSKKKKSDDAVCIYLNQNPRKITGFMTHSDSQGSAHNEKTVPVEVSPCSSVHYKYSRLWWHSVLSSWSC